jgi:hypothetical protein
MFAIFGSLVVVGAFEKVDINEHLGSFLETSTVERLRRAEAEAQKQAKEAEEAWQQSRQKTDALLSKVRSEMASLNEDLKKTAEKQKEDLAMLEKSREKETAALKETETKLKELQETAKVEAPMPSSFIDQDFLAPLRKAAADAKAFAEKIRKESQESRFGQASSSFLEEDNDYAAKAERSLAMAQQALSKLDADLASQKRELEAQLAKAKKDEEAVREGTAFHGASFLETEQMYDPLSPQALAEWRDKFNAQLQRAREAAGIKTPFKSSLVQLDTSMDEKLKEDENKVSRLQEEFNAQMAKLKEDNAAMLAEAQAQIEKAKNMKAKLLSDMQASSFLEGPSGHAKFDAEAEKQKIMELQRKWQAEAEQLTAPSQPSEAENQLMKLIEEQKTQQASAQAELDRLKQKLHKDIEALHKDMTASSLAAQPSFVETRMDFMDLARDIVEKLHQFTAIDSDSESTKPTIALKTPAVEPVDASEAALETVKETEPIMEAEEVPAAKESDSSAVEVKPSNPDSQANTDEKATESAPKADAEVAEAPVPEASASAEAVAPKPEILAETTPVQASFVELAARDAADEALARAEQGLKKLQEQLRQQSSKLSSYGVTI